MRHEKIVKREDGTQYQICVHCRIDSYMGGSFNYDIGVLYRDKGKRKWLSLPDTLYDFEYRKLSIKEREIHKSQNNLRFVTKEEIHAAKTELWYLLKPEM